MKRIILATAFSMCGGMAMAAMNTDALIADLQAQGYTWIEVKRGPTQIKVEAVKGTMKIETVYDAETGAIIDSETETASAGEQGRTGVEVSTRNRDFEDTGDDSSDDAGSDDDDTDDGRSDDDDGSDDDGTDDDGSDDDDADDDGSDDSGSDDDGSDDRDSGDDDSGDDDSDND